MNSFVGMTETKSEVETLGNLTVAVKSIILYVDCILYIDTPMSCLRDHNLLSYLKAFCTEFLNSL